MKFQFSVLLLIFNLFIVVFADQQKIHTHDISKTDYINDGQQIVINPATTTVSYQHTISTSNNQQQQQQNQVPVRWRSADRDTKININHDDDHNNLNSNIITSNFQQRTNQESNDYIERKHEESRRRTIRIRILTSQQNELKKELQSNETLLSEQIKMNNHLAVESNNIQLLIHAIRDCIQRFERIQVELQKLYRDQIHEEKQLLEYYKQVKPTNSDLHNQLKFAIARWELIYNQLLEMQLNEKKRNEERERKYDQLVNELHYRRNSSYSSKQSIHPDSNQHQIIQSTYSPSSHHQQIVHSSYPQSSSTFHTTYPHPNSQHQAIHQSPSISKSISSSSFSSSSYLSSNQNNTSYSSFSNLKSSGVDPNHQNVIFSSNNGGKTQSDLETNSIIFRRPEISSLKNKDIECLSKWFEDLGKEDADWIARNQLKNEKFFEELVRLQKQQWDAGYFEHKQKKAQHAPQFKCDLETKSLCDQEEENFKKVFNQYHSEQYPTKLDQQYANQQQNYVKKVYNN